MAWIALGAAAFFLFRSEQQVATVASALRTFDVRARETADALSDARAAQQAYVAEGQAVTFWMPKVAATIDAVTTSIGELRATATDSNTRAALDEAAAAFVAFGDIDKRARDYMKSGQQLMAGDVIFTEGGQTAATAGRLVETARQAEHQALDAKDAAVRKQEALAIGGAAAFAALMVMLLVPARPTAAPAEAVAVETSSAAPAVSVASAPAAQAAVPRNAAATVHSGLLKAAAELATDFGRLRDVNDLTLLLRRAAKVMDASGLVVWMGSLNGADLRPVLAHGYSDETMARMAPVPRAAGNAAAAAYRSGKLQIVASSPGSSGAIVAPILVPDGCIGALSAEFRGTETSESIQSLTAIVASHLATVLSDAPRADAADEPRAAAQG
jgi:hypothetical protein